jgi:osmotically inducible protein OsmC
MAARSGEAEWQGDLSSGSGRLMVGEERWASAYSFNSRFDAVLPGAVATGPATSPEELLAAAHAACFSMALSLALTEHGEAPRTEKRRARRSAAHGEAPRTIDTLARVHLRLVGGLPTIQRIDLETGADVPDIDEAGFQARGEEAKSGCILSRALGGVAEINLFATLR